MEVDVASGSSRVRAHRSLAGEPCVTTRRIPCGFEGLVRGGIIGNRAAHCQGRGMQVSGADRVCEQFRSCVAATRALRESFLVATWIGTRAATHGCRPRPMCASGRRLDFPRPLLDYLPGPRGGPGFPSTENGAEHLMIRRTYAV